jgi:hypothetical protein
MLLYALLFTAATADTVPSPDSTRAAAPVTLSTPLLSVDEAPLLRTPMDVVGDTTPRRPRAKAIEYSDWYEKRLAIHKAASWAMLPLFVGQYYTGSTRVSQGTDSPTWVKRVHPVLATGVLALFATNTVTGVWNLWEGRAEPKGRTWRFAHSILMLASDAGFAYVGQLSKDAKVSGSARDRHRTAAIVSGSMAMASYVMMLSPFRRDQ